MTNMLGRFAIIGEPLSRKHHPDHDDSDNDGGSPATMLPAKALRLAVFVPRVPASLDYNVRVYFVEDTADAVESILQVERQLDGCLLDKSKQILFSCAAGANLCLSVESLAFGWRLKQGTICQEIPFGHIWNGTQSGLHCSFALEHVDQDQRLLSCDVVVCQAGHLGNQRVIHIAHDVTAGAKMSPTYPIRYSVHSSDVLDSEADPLYVPLGQLDNNGFRLSQSAKDELCALLEHRSHPLQHCGAIWPAIAEQLGLNRNLGYFAARPRPVEHILDLWEVMCHDRSYRIDLASVLWYAGLADATAIVKSELGRS
jgi:leucine-rich repeat transmembrane protein FLRT